MIGQSENDPRTCIWIPFERSQKEWTSLCEPSSPVPKESIVLNDSGCDCKRCLRIAEKIAEDKEKLEKR